MSFNRDWLSTWQLTLTMEYPIVVKQLESSLCTNMETLLRYVVKWENKMKSSISKERCK